MAAQRAASLVHHLPARSLEKRGYRRARLDSGKRGFHGFLGGLLVVVVLEIEPDFGRPAEIPLQPQRGVHGEGAVALEGFRSVAGRDGEVVEFGDGVELGEFPQGDALNVRRHPALPSPAVGKLELDSLGLTGQSFIK